jgi:hypothetical protein
MLKREGEDRALRDARVDEHRRRFLRTKKTGSGTTTDISGNPSHHIRVHSRVRELFEKDGVVDRVKGFGDVKQN